MKLKRLDPPAKRSQKLVSLYDQLITSDMVRMTTLDLEPIKERLADLQQPDDHPIRALFEVADLAALVAEVELLRGQVEAVKKIIRSPGITTVKGSPADRIMRILEVRK